MKYDFWFPWPLSNRECLLEFSAFPVPEDQSMLIIMRTPNDSYLNTLLPASQNGSIRMSIPIGCILVKYISPYLTKISILVQANASTIPTNLLPEWLLNFGKKQIMYFLMDSLRKTVLEFKGSEYESKLLSNPEFYGFLKKVLSTDVDIS